MSQALTVTVPDELAAWIEEAAQRRQIPAEEIVREHLQRARAGAAATGGEPPADRPRRFLRLAGTIQGAPDLSARRGFSRG